MKEIYFEEVFSYTDNISRKKDFIVRKARRRKKMLSLIFAICMIGFMGY